MILGDDTMIRLLEYKVDGMMLLYDWMIILSKMIGGCYVARL